MIFININYKELFKRVNLFFIKSLIEMGIDLKAGGRIVNKSKKESRSVNVYLRLLIKVNININSFIHSYQEELKLNLIK